MKTLLTYLLLPFLLISCFSCASIVSDSSYTMSLQSSPKGANVKVVDRKGEVIFVGTTPAVVDLDAGAGYFRKASYRVEYQLDGYDSVITPVNFTLDGWYFTNILWGGFGFIGFLIVDPISGAMYKLKYNFIHKTLREKTSSNDLPRLEIYDLNHIPAEWMQQLEVVQP